MSKDPAFLFYYQDFLVGTSFMKKEEVGLYIIILCHMADKGHLNEKHMLSICNGYAFTDLLKEKFLVDENGLYYNKRLEDELVKRKNYTESRRKNAKAYAEHMPQHMEDVNENINSSLKASLLQTNITINKKEKKSNMTNALYNKFDEIWSKYPLKDGKKEALIHFKSTIKTEQDWSNINKALNNYLVHLNKNSWKKPKNGKTWFNNWADWIEWKEPEQTLIKVMEVKQPEYKTDTKTQEEVSRLIHETAIKMKGGNKN